MVKGTRSEFNTNAGQWFTKLNQEQLGKLIDVQKARISKLESGASSATISTITKVFRALKARVKLQIEIEDETEFAVS